MNALSGDTYVFAEIDGKYGVYLLRELFEIHKNGHKIKVPALLDEHGNIGWVEIENVVNYELKSLKRITLFTSRLFVEATEDAIIPAYSHNLFSRREKRINLKFKSVNELKVTEDPRYNNDSLLLAMYIPLKIPKGDQKDYEYGFALGFWLAEGWLEKRKHSFTKQSLAKLSSFARKKGMALEQYLEYMTDIERVGLGVGESDFERKYVDIVQKHFNFSAPYKQKHANAYILRSSDLSFIRLIKNYIDGSDSHTKHIKNEVYNRSRKFLEGILDGYLAGDSHFKKDLDLFHVNMTANFKLRDDLIFLSKVLGYDIHLHNGRFDKSPSSNNYYYHLHLNIFKNWHRYVAFGLVKEHIKSVEIIKKEAFNLVVKPLYSENDKRAKFNHLFFTAYGFLVSDAVKTLDRSVLSSSLSVPVSSKV